jgi:hypothetical protein
VRYLLLLTLMACSNHPLKAGGYSILLTTFTNDTCGFAASDVGVGTTWDAHLSWDAEDIVIEGFQADSTYQNEGDYWAAAYDSSRTTDICTETFSEEHELSVIDETDFEIQAVRRLGQRGTCSDTPAPCTYDLVYSGTRN